MKNNMPEKDTFSYRLISLIAIAGEIPAAEIKRIPGGESYKKKIINMLKRNNIIRTYYADGIKAYRLTRNAKNFLLSENPQRFDSALTGQSDTSHIKSELTRRLRLHRIAEAAITMQNAGVYIYTDEKTDVFSPVWEQGKNILTPAFYNSREIKACGSSFVKIYGARSVGVLFTKRNVFIVYNTGNANMKWSYKAEMRTKALIKTMICQDRLPELYSNGDVNGLLLGNNMKSACEILKEEYNKQYFILDGNYEHFYYLTNDHKGECLLKLLCDEKMRKQLENILLADLCTSDKSINIESDATDENGNPVMFAYTCDLPRIKRFNTALQLQNMRGVIICFDYQMEAICKACSSRVEFQTIDFEKWERSFCEKA